jgi:hypothetical protein
MGIPADQMMAMLQGAYEPEPADQDRINALRRQQALGVLGQMGGANVGQFGQALYSGAGGELEQMAEQRQAASGQMGKRLDLAMKMMDYNEKVQEQAALQGAGLDGSGIPDLGDLKEFQGKSLTYARKGASPLGNLRTMLDEGYEPNIRDKALFETGGVGMMGNLAGVMSTDEGSQYVANAKELLAAILRRESGAAITADEWASYAQQYIPMPWDPPELRRQKLRHAEDQLMSNAYVAGKKAAPFLIKEIKTKGASRAKQKGTTKGGGADDIIDLPPR